MNDLMKQIGILSFDRSVAAEFIFDVQSFNDPATDKQDVRGELHRSRYEFLAEVFGSSDAAELRLFVVVVTDNVAANTPRTGALLQDVGRLKLHSLEHSRDIQAKSGLNECLVKL